MPSWLAFFFSPCRLHELKTRKARSFPEKKRRFTRARLAVLWCSWSHIYGVSEGQWRLLPGTARPLCRQVNCRNSLLLHQEAPVRVESLDTGVLNWNLQSILQELRPGWGKPQCTSFVLPQYYWIEESLLLVRRFISLPISPNFILKALRISSGVY